MILTAQLDPRRLGDFYVYSIHNVVTGACLFVGYDTLAAVVNLSTVRAAPGFNNGEAVGLHIHSVHTGRLDAMNAQSRKIRELCGMSTPPLNIGYRNQRQSAVVCEQTGTQYPTASAAAEAHDVDAARMSKHLARRRGFKTVRGFTFRYVGFYDKEAGKRVPTAPTPDSGVTVLRVKKNGHVFHFHNGVPVAHFDNNGQPMGLDGLKPLSMEEIQQGLNDKIFENIG